MLSLISYIAVAALAGLANADHPTHTAEIYYLTNCFNPVTFASSAEFDWYANSTLSVLGGLTTPPDLKDVIVADTSVDYEDGTWVSNASSPFTLVVVIDVDAYTATAGSTVGHATSSSFEGTMKCLRLTRVVPCETSTVTCYADYACIDSGTELP